MTSWICSPAPCAMRFLREPLMVFGKRLLKQHMQMERMMKKMSRGGMKKMMRGMPGGGMPPGLR